MKQFESGTTCWSPTNKMNCYKRTHQLTSHYTREKITDKMAVAEETCFWLKQPELWEILTVSTDAQLAQMCECGALWYGQITSRNKEKFKVNCLYSVNGTSFSVQGRAKHNIMELSVVLPGQTQPSAATGRERSNSLYSTHELKNHWLNMTKHRPKAPPQQSWISPTQHMNGPLRDRVWAHGSQREQLS